MKNNRQGTGKSNIIAAAILAESPHMPTKCAVLHDVQCFLQSNPRRQSKASIPRMPHLLIYE